ncbi:MAG: hypothetical protein BGO31_04055 [Bacteroidetes bacterium 43-16]|nr:MAG: hypothetical protein BGO31_04055 [Bacteroidetes bacterium 43-16]
MNKFYPTYFIMFLAFFCGSSLAFAQPEWQWGKRGGSFASASGAFAHEEVMDMVTDKHNNIYVLSIHNQGAVPDVDGHSGTSMYDNIILSSWTCDGGFRWMKTFGTAGSTIARNLGIDTFGGLYVAGINTSTNAARYAYFDTDTALGYSTKSFFLIKYDTSGNFMWLKRPQPDTASVTATSFTAPYGLAVAPNGNSYLFSHLSPGSYNNAAYIVSEYGFHLLAYDRDGLFISGTPMDITVSATAWGPDLNNLQVARFNRDHRNGKCYLYGQYLPDFGSLAFGTSNLEPANPGIGVGPMYLAAFAPTGAPLWVKQSTPANAILTRNCKPVLDQQGNIYIGGDAFPLGTNVFNGYTFTNSMGDGMVAFVSSLDSNGNQRWTTNADTDGEILGSGISYANNTVSLTGSYGREVQWDSKELTNRIGSTSGTDIFLAKFNAFSGEIVSLDSLVTTGNGNTGTSVANDRNGNVYVGGRFSEQLYPGSAPLNSAGGTYDWFVAKFGATNCNCAIPVPDFSYAATGPNTLSFTYTGTSPFTAISWDFGDGSAPSATTNPTHTYSAGSNYTVCVTVTNDCGTNTYCMLVNASGSSNIGSIPGFPRMNFYPNPATQMIHIDHAAAGTILDVYNATGKHIMQATLRGNKDIVDISKLAKGIYLLHFTGKNGKQGSTRLVKH